MKPRVRRDLQRPACPAQAVRVRPGPILQPFEERQNVGIAPPRIAALPPVVEILRGATIKNVAVERGRPAQHLAARAAGRPRSRYFHALDEAREQKYLLL